MKLELLNRIQALEDKGFIVFIKWDGKRSSGKKTMMASLPGSDFQVRRDGDDLWKLCEEMVAEAENQAHD